VELLAMRPGAPFSGEGGIFEQALRATSFDGCPSPDEWRSLLRNALKTVGGSSPTSGSGASSGARVKQPCAQCGQGFWIGQEKLAELQHQGKQALCPVCLQTQLQQSAVPWHSEGEPRCRTGCHGSSSSSWASYSARRSYGRSSVCGECPCPQPLEEGEPQCRSSRASP
jgi:hypothetical protein